MNRKALPPLSEAQLEIMNFVWDQGEVTVGQVWNELTTRRDVSRNTIQTLIVRLRDKGWLRERIDEGAHRYRATKKRAGTQKQIVIKLLDTVFAGSTEGLVMALLGSRQLTKAEADRIRQLIDDAEEAKAEQKRAAKAKKKK